MKEASRLGVRAETNPALQMRPYSANSGSPWKTTVERMDFTHFSPQGHSPCDPQHLPPHLQHFGSPMTPDRFPSNDFSNMHWIFDLSPNGSPVGSPGGARGLHLPVSLDSPGGCSPHGPSSSPSSNGSPDSTGSTCSFSARRRALGDVEPAYFFRDRGCIRRPARWRLDRKTFALDGLSLEDHHAMYSPLTSRSSNGSVPWDTSDSMSDRFLSSSPEQSSSPEHSSPL